MRQAVAAALARLALAGGVLLAAVPAHADAACQQGWRHLTGIIFGFGDGTGPFGLPVIPDELLAIKDIPQEADRGWCVLTMTPDADGSDITAARWRALPTDFADDPDGLPGTVTFEIGIARPGAPVDATITLSHAPADGLLILDFALHEDAPRPVLTGSAVLGGAFFSNPRAAQMSLPGLYLTRAAGMLDTASVTGREMADDLVVDEVDAFAASLSDAQIDGQSRAALRDFARQITQPGGLVEVDLSSDRGLSWIQIGAAASQPEGEVARFMLDGARLRVGWRPH